MDKLEEILCNLIDDVANHIYEDKTVLSTSTMLDLIEKSKTREKIVDMIQRQKKLSEGGRPTLDQPEYHVIIRKDDKINSLLSLSLRFLNEDQLIVLRDCLIERTPKISNDTNNS